MKNKRIVALVTSAIIGMSQNSLIVFAEEGKEKKLEQNIIHVYGLGTQATNLKEGNNHKFNIGFDEEKKEFKVFDKNSVILHNYFKDRKYFEIKVFNKDGIEKLHVNLLGSDSAQSEKLNKLNGFKYEYGDIVQLWFAEPKKESIAGNIIDAKEDYSDKIQNRDFIDNVVFEITENGLKSIYNNAPEIKGIENLKLRLKTPFDKLQGVLVTDDHDGHITNKLIVTGEVNTEVAGNYPIEYKVIDKWGRETKVTRIITVSESSKLESNIIHIDNLTNKDIKDIFKIGFDDFENKIKIYDLKEDYINDSNINEKNFYIKIIGKNKKEKLLINLNGNDKGTTEKLKILNNFKYEYGDIIKLWSINGSNERIEGEIVEGKENYSDGIQGVDGFPKIDNVKFEITKEGLKAIYNSTPEIKGIEDINIKVGDSFNKIEGVSAIDLEHGDISKKIAVAGTVDTTKPGENLLEYSVIDSEGNKTIATRKVIVSERKALEKNIICTEGIGRIKHRDKFKIGFDEDKKEIKVYSQSWSHLHNYYLKKDYFKIIIMDKNLKEKLNITLDGSVRGTTAKLDPLKGFKYEYGDIIKLWHAEAGKQIIYGNIINGREDYSKGIRGIAGFKAIDDVVFEITENGLKAIYNTPPQIKGAKDIEIKVGEIFTNNIGVTAVDDRDGDITNKLIISGNVDTSNPGLYTVDYSVVNSWGKETIIKRRISVKDNKKPVINGLENLVIRIGEEFSPLKDVKAIDEEDGDLTSKIQVSGDVNTNVTSRYNLVYSVTDSAGNTSIGTRTVRVIPSKRPAIIGADNTTIKMNEYFNPLKGVSAQDWQNKDITNKIKVTGEVIEEVSGKYNLVYSVEDEEKNYIIATRTVNVRSNDKPHIIGVDNLIISTGDNFDPRIGVMATDKEDSELTANIEISGVVNTHVPGIYNIIYSVQDNDGNKTSVSRNVTVRSKNKPVIVGVDDVSVKEGDNFDPLLGVMAHDKEDGNLTDSINIVGVVNTKISANYNLVYSVSDKDGNQYSITRKIVVRTNDKPIIKGAEDITIKVNEAFDIMLGITASDIEDGDLTNNINLSGDINNKISGRYNLVYTVKDKDGNISAVTRRVTVRSDDKPVITGASDLSININDEFDPMTGIIANDVQDGDLTKDITISGHLDNKTNGKYNLVYSVIDKDGNKSIVTRRITVRTPGKPMIRGIDDISIRINDKFDPMSGVVATDAEDGDLTKSIVISGHVDNKVNGKYNLVYSVTDSEGNQSIITRKVTVRTNDRPIIRGLVDVIINEGQPFDAMEGIIASDSEDGDLSKNVKIEAHVDHEVHGKYNLIYSVEDKDGNKTVATRIINVRSNEKPTIRGAENITIKTGDVFDAKVGVIAVDKENNDLTNEIKIVGDVNNNIAGEYNVIYSVIDKNGNESNVTRVVKVKNVENPVIVGKDNIKIKVGEKFDEKSAVIAIDKDNKDLTEKIEVKGKVNSDAVGTYNITYSVQDENNNKTTEERQVTVVKDDFPIIEGAEKILIKNSQEFNALQGISAKDKKYGEMTSLVKVDGTVNNKVNGKYKITYSVKNKDGNETIVPREVIVGEDINLIDEGINTKNQILKEDYKNEKNNAKPIKALIAIGAIGAAIAAAAVSIFKMKK